MCLATTDDAGEAGPSTSGPVAAAQTTEAAQTTTEAAQETEAAQTTITEAAQTTTEAAQTVDHAAAGPRPAETVEPATPTAADSHSLGSDRALRRRRRPPAVPAKPQRKNLSRFALKDFRCK